MRLTVRKKLLLSFATIALFLIVVSGITFYQMTEVNQNYQSLLETNSEMNAMSISIERLVNEQSTSLRGYFLSSDPYLIKNLEEANESIHQVIGEMKTRDISDEAEKHLDTILRLNEELKISTTEARQFFFVQQRRAYEMVSEEIIPIEQEMLEATTKFSNTIENELTLHIQNTEHSVSRTLNLVLIISIVGIIFSLCIGLVASNMISKPLIRLSKMANEIAGGKITSTEEVFKGNDEVVDLYQAFQRMSEHLRTVMKQISDHSVQVNHSAQQLAVSSEQTSEATEYVSVSIDDIAKGTELQTTSTNECVIALEQLAAGIQDLAEYSKHISNGANTSIQYANEGQMLVKQTVDGMGSIRHSVEQSDEVIKQLYQRSTKIGAILEMISTIAEQTNLLAINAGIEAARAGDHGRGFAVVANEVKKLAEQSAHSTIEIRQIVQHIQSDTKESVDMIGGVTAKVEAGMELAAETEAKFNLIFGTIDTISAQIQQLTSVSQQMVSQSQGLMQAIENIANIASSNAENAANVSAASEETLASMEDIVSTSTSLNKMAEALRSILDQFMYEKKTDQTEKTRYRKSETSSDVDTNDSKKITR
ncbi:methyl-accepting chemotaxis protein [Alkalihalobacterium sp. APHAB7]|uniref:methyl-accepting chemotaxis protein n=1 Tax=Alkalihalobacterium sp. APHAB7 TaxID=3402081 RepID=UPI003AAE226C